MNNKDLVKKFQSAMNVKGETLAVDGDFGPKTTAASEKYDVEVIVFPRALKLPEKTEGLTPIEWARTQLGQKEISGSKDNPVIVEYHKHSENLKGEQADEVPWCSSFLNAAADKCGMKKTNNALASSWKNYGEDSGDLVEEGDIVLLTSSVGSGHVTMANKAFSRSKNSTFEGLGGNQSNSVNVSTYPTSRIVTCRKWSPLAGKS